MMQRRHRLRSDTTSVDSTSDTDIAGVAWIAAVLTGSVHHKRRRIDAGIQAENPAQSAAPSRETPALAFVPEACDLLDLLGS